MSRLRRRDFLKTTVALLWASVGGCPQIEPGEKETPKPSRWHGFKYAMCNESMREKSWGEQCQIVANAGYTGIEIAAFTLVKEGVQEITPAHRKEMEATMKDAGIECAGLHWLLAPPPKGLHFTTGDEPTRKKSIKYLEELIDFCGDVGGTVMIFGSPKQRSTVGTSIDEAKKYFADGLAKVADHAKSRGVKILVEPLDTGQTDVVNRMAEALEIVKRVKHPAIELMFDFHNTGNETEAFDVLIKRFHKHIFHIHVQEMDGKHLGGGSGVNDYVKAFQVLKDLQYDKWISLEVFDFSPGGKRIAEESMKVLNQIESKLI
ncbi:MAG: sugar phosphate isomerase/epimerase [Planctomycetota bacterium]|nr:MAG: sugar phosphate isomerase/epimerase [Planctomycetota bacterium]